MTKGMDDDIGLWWTIWNRGVAIQMSDVSGAKPPVQWVKTVECEPAETNQDETIEESNDYVIVSQELKPRIVLKYF